MGDMSDWVPAVLCSLTGAPLTFEAGGIPVVRTFDSPSAAAALVAKTGPRFEFSALLGAVRCGNGEVIALPELAQPQRFVPPAACSLVLGGHRPHYIPVLRAEGGPWEPVEVVALAGQKATLATAEGVFDAYYHDPEVLREVTEVNRRYRVLRGQRSLVYSATPIGPCVA